MKRSVLMSALVLALASSLAVTACGGGGGSDQPAKDADSADKKDGDSGGTPSSGDPVADMQAISDGIQKDVDAVLQPIKDADALLDSIGNIPKDLKAAKSKVDPKKLMAELKKIVAGGDANLDALKMEDSAKAAVQERIDKLKALVADLKDVDTKVKALVDRVTDAAPKLAASAAKAIGKLEAKIKAPIGVSADDKKKAQEDKDKINAIVDGFKKKADEWQKLFTDMPAKAKSIPDKLKKIFG